jgi:hypothetical protein
MIDTSGFAVKNGRFLHPGDERRLLMGSLE